MRYRLLPALASAGVLCMAQSAYAGTLTVDDDKVGRIGEASRLPVLWVDSRALPLPEVPGDEVSDAADPPRAFSPAGSFSHAPMKYATATSATNVATATPRTSGRR